MSSDYDEREGHEEDHTDRDDYPEEVWDQVQAERRRLEGGDDDDYLDAMPEPERDEETETFISLISRLYDQAFSSANMIESCARYFGWPDLDIRDLGEKASNALEQAEGADDVTRRVQLVTALCEVLESECPPLEHYRERLQTERRDLAIMNIMVENSIRRIGELMEESRPYRT